jgi:hypothetical protein
MKPKKKHNQPPIVKDVLTNWRKMHGANSLEKRLNAFLTSYFVVSEAPKDECIKLAQKIAKLKKPTWENVYKLLHSSFGTAYKIDATGIKGPAIDLATTGSHIESSLRHGTAFILALLKILK